MDGPTTFLKLALSHIWHFQGRIVVPSTVKPVQNEIKTRFIHVRSRKLAPACLSLESRRGSKLMRYSNPSSALAPIKWRKQSHSKGSVSPQLQSGRSLCVSSCNYLPTWSICWPVGRIGIFRPESTSQTQTLELCHLLASNSEIEICVAPSVEISLDSNT